MAETSAIVLICLALHVSVYIGGPAIFRFIYLLLPKDWVLPPCICMYADFQTKNILVTRLLLASASVCPLPPTVHQFFPLVFRHGSRKAIYLSVPKLHAGHGAVEALYV